MWKYSHTYMQIQYYGKLRKYYHSNTSLIDRLDLRCFSEATTEQRQVEYIQNNKFCWHQTSQAMKHTIEVKFATFNFCGSSKL